MHFYSEFRRYNWELYYIVICDLIENIKLLYYQSCICQWKGLKVECLNVFICVLAGPPGGEGGFTLLTFATPHASVPHSLFIEFHESSLCVHSKVTNLVSTTDWPQCESACVRCAEGETTSQQMCLWFNVVTMQYVDETP